MLRDSLCLCRSQLVLDVARVLWCNCLSLWIVNSLLLKGAEQNYYFYSQLERADSFPTENMTTQKIICQSLFFWVFFFPLGASQFSFSCCHSHLQISHKTLQMLKERRPFLQNFMYFLKDWFLHARVSGFLSVAWVRLPLEKELAPWIQCGRHVDSICYAIYFMF